MLKKYVLYVIRWQLSTPILALALWAMNGFNFIISTIVANLLGALIFFWIDRIIFSERENMDEKLYYVCCGNIGITKFEDSSMPSIMANKNKEQWIKFDSIAANKVSKYTNWKMLVCN